MKICVKINPLDYSKLSEISQDLMQVSTKSDVEIQSDVSISKGGCYVETEMGVIDATIETRIDQIKGVLKQ